MQKWMSSSSRSVQGTRTVVQFVCVSNYLQEPASDILNVSKEPEEEDLIEITEDCDKKCEVHIEQEEK